MILNKKVDGRLLDGHNLTKLGIFINSALANLPGGVAPGKT
jgi:hypothetical protein